MESAARSYCPGSLNEDEINEWSRTELRGEGMYEYETIGALDACAERCDIFERNHCYYFFTLRCTQTFFALARNKLRRNEWNILLGLTRQR